MNIARNASYYMSEYNRTEQTVLTLILCVIMILAFYGNAGILLVIYKNDKMWNSTNILIGNLAIAGVLVTVLTMPFSLISIVMRKWPFKDGPVCKFNAFINSMLLLVTIFIHTLISIDKYYSVVKPFSRTMTVKKTWKIVFLVFVIAIVMSMGPLFNIGQYEYNQTALVCGAGFPQNNLDSVYLFVLFILGFAVPNITSIHVYVKVCFAVRNHSRRIRKACVSHCSMDVMKLQKRLICTSMLSLVCFLFCWTPFAVYVTMGILMESIDKIPHGLGVSAYWCGYFYNALNPLVICSMSNRYGDGLYEITTKMFSCYTCRGCFARCIMGSNWEDGSARSNFTDISVLPPNGTKYEEKDLSNGQPLIHLTNLEKEKQAEKSTVSTFKKENGNVVSTTSIILKYTS